jgi:hypothetical protein
VIVEPAHHHPFSMKKKHTKRTENKIPKTKLHEKESP